MQKLPQLSAIGDQTHLRSDADRIYWAQALRRKMPGLLPAYWAAARAIEMAVLTFYIYWGNGYAWLLARLRSTPLMSGLVLLRCATRRKCWSLDRRLGQGIVGPNGLSGSLGVPLYWRYLPSSPSAGIVFFNLSGCSLSQQIVRAQIAGRPIDLLDARPPPRREAMAAAWSAWRRSWRSGFWHRMAFIERIGPCNIAPAGGVA